MIVQICQKRRHQQRSRTSQISCNQIAILAARVCFQKKFLVVCQTLTPPKTTGMLQGQITKLQNFLDLLKLREDNPSVFFGIHNRLPSTFAPDPTRSDYALFVLRFITSSDFFERHGKLCFLRPTMVCHFSFMSSSSLLQTSQTLIERCKALRKVLVESV